MGSVMSEKMMVMGSAISEKMIAAGDGTPEKLAFMNQSVTMEELLRIVEKLKADREKLLAGNRELMAENREMRAEYDNLLEENNEIKLENRNLLTENNEIRIENNNLQAENTRLQVEIENHESSMVRMRVFNDEQSLEMLKREEAKRNDPSSKGHNLLGKNKKIIVVGDCHIRPNDLKGICKKFGFDKDDVVFEADYEKITNFGSRLLNSTTYDAVIFGKVPHIASGIEGCSSLIERVKNDEYGPYPVDARTKSGELCVTKESFRAALTEVIDYLENQTKMVG